eukprot:213750-Chlamydomonas_euryale.AAC.1
MRARLASEQQPAGCSGVAAARGAAVLRASPLLDARCVRHGHAQAAWVHGRRAVVAATVRGGGRQGGRQLWS